MSTTECPVCKSTIINSESNVRGFRGGYEYDCPRCGTFQLDVVGKHILVEQSDFYGFEERIKLSNLARKNWEFSAQPMLLVGNSFPQYVSQAIVRNPVAQAELLVLWLGSRLESVGDDCILSENEYFEAVIGARCWDDVVFIFQELVNQRILASMATSNSRIQTRLTFLGWERYKEILQGISESNRVFMAMKFGNPDLDQLFNDHYKPALKSLGYELFRLDEQPSAGSITNKMRVAIKEAKFVVADLSYGNRGAYWEAGFAEGLGKHVIYSVNKSRVSEGQVHPDHHFDVQGQQTVFWNESEMANAADQLIDVIKATFF